MFLDGSSVEVGDRVHHITQGAGIVATISAGSARISMVKGGILNMSEGGYHVGKRRFYWSRPVIVPPKKNSNIGHDEFMRLINTLIEWRAS